MGHIESPWAVLAWAALLVAIVVSFRPAVPVIWGDTPSFVESALRTLEAGRPTVAGGRDPGYPAFLAVTFAFGGGLRTVVYLQQAAWAVLMLALAATAQAATRNAGGLVPIILVATYPGLLLFRNVLTADLLFAVFLNLAMAGLLVATCVDKAARCYAVAASVLCAALAACFRSQGILVPIAAIVVGARLAWPDTYARLAVMTVSVAAALALLAAGSRFGASDSDQASVFASSGPPGGRGQYRRSGAGRLRSAARAQEGGRCCLPHLLNVPNQDTRDQNRERRDFCVHLALL